MTCDALLFGPASGLDSCLDMTLIYGFIGREAIVFGADQREVSNGVYSDVADKVIEVGRNVCIGVSGDGSGGAYIVERLAKTNGWGPGVSLDAFEVSEVLTAGVKKALSDEGVDPANPPTGRSLPTFLVSGHSRRAAGEEPQPYLIAQTHSSGYGPKVLRNAAFTSVGVENLLRHIEKYVSRGDLARLSLGQLDRIAVLLLSEAGHLCANMSCSCTVRHIFPERVERVDVSCLLHDVEAFREGVRELVRTKLLCV